MEVCGQCGLGMLTLQVLSSEYQPAMQKQPKQHPHLPTGIAMCGSSTVFTRCTRKENIRGTTVSFLKMPAAQGVEPSTHPARLAG